MPAGSAPGERRGGREKGTPNKATAEIKALAQMHGPAMVEELVRLAQKATSEQARVSAIGMLLDRGYGKATQPIDGNGEGGPIVVKVMRFTDA